MTFFSPPANACLFNQKGGEIKALMLGPFDDQSERDACMHIRTAQRSCVSEGLPLTTIYLFSVKKPSGSGEIESHPGRPRP